jgi:FkbM family methyltransferase
VPPDAILPAIPRRLVGLVQRSLFGAAHPRDTDATARRVAMTIGCRDADPIPKVPRAGAVFEHQGRLVQLMHEGTLVEAGGYHGDWMRRIIRELRGHHEPQEELVFHHLVARCRPGTTIVEVGAFWAFYTNWYLGAVAGSSAVCLEPDAANMACGQRNLALNGRSATWINACVGSEHAEALAIRRESDGATVSVPCHSLDSLLDLTGRRPVEMLHVDCQGAELPLLISLGRAVQEGLLRFVVMSTHHASISGSPTTHQDCLRQLEHLGATILCEHTVEESFSGDGLIVASFHAADAAIELPAISRNEPRRSLFPPGGDRPVVLAHTNGGPMLVFEEDTVIGRALRDHGSFEEEAVADVVRCLRRRHGFRPRLFVDVGANIGTHLLRGLRDGTFPRGVGVEMDRGNFRLLTANVHLAGCENRVTLFNVAASDRIGEVSMEVEPGNFGDHRVRLQNEAAAASYGEHDREVRRVGATTLDALETDSHTRFDEGTLVWIDTQGHEGHVLAGAERILARERRPFVVLEFWPYGVERCGGRERLFRFLQRCRAVHDMRSPGWETRPAVTATALEQLYDSILARAGEERLTFTDLLCIP